MQPIRDALELLTAQHEELDELLDLATRSRAPHVVRELVDKLTIHLAVEQALLYPLVRTHVGEDVMAEILAEHLAIKRALADLVWHGVDDADFESTLSLLAALLAGHTAWQEDQLFTAAAESMPTEVLVALGDQLLASAQP